MASKFERAFNEIQPEIKAPEGNKIGWETRREGKSANTSIALRKSVKDALTDIAAEQGISRNELINIVLEDYINNYLEGKI